MEGNQIMLALTILSITIYALVLVRNRGGISSDTIIASTVALVGFDVLLLTVGLTIGAIVFLVATIAFIWLFETLRRPRVTMLRLPGGVVVGFGIMRQVATA